MKIFRNSGLYYVLAIMLLFSMVVPNLQASAASKVSKSWSLSFSGNSLFQPVFNKDGSMFVGSSQVINEVYYADFMTIDPKGAKKSTWELKGASQFRGDFKIGGTGSAPVIYNIDYSKGKIVTYNQKGKELWKKDYNTEIIDPVITDPNGNIVFMTGKKIIRYTTQGKRTLYIDAPSNIGYYSLDSYEFLKDGSFYLLPPDSKYPLKRYNASGKKLWERKLGTTEELAYTNGKEINYIDDKNTIYISSYVSNYIDNEYYSKLTAIDSNGKLIWSKKFTESNYGSFYLDKNNSKIHLVPTWGKYYTFSSKGALLNKQEIIPTDSSGYLNGAVIKVQRLSSNGGLYILTWQSNKNHLLYFDNQGKKQWDKELTGQNWNLMTFNNELVTTSSTIKGYSKDGKLNWQYKLANDSLIYFNEKNSMIYAQSTEWVENSKGIYYPKSTITALKKAK